MRLQNFSPHNGPDFLSLYFLFRFIESLGKSTLFRQTSNNPDTTYGIFFFHLFYPFESRLESISAKIINCVSFVGLIFFVIINKHVCFEVINIVYGKAAWYMSAWFRSLKYFKIYQHGHSVFLWVESIYFHEYVTEWF